MSLLDVSDTALANALDVSRQTVHNRRKGRQRMSVDHIEETAQALGVDPRLFLGSELEAIRWVAEHQPDRFDTPDDDGGGDGKVTQLFPSPLRSHRSDTVVLRPNFTKAA